MSNALSVTFCTAVLVSFAAAALLNALEAVLERMPVLKAATDTPAGGFKVGGQGSNSGSTNGWNNGNAAKNSGETKRWNKNR